MTDTMKDETMKAPLDHLRSRKKPVRKTVWIAGDGELVDALAEAEGELSRMRASADTYRNSRAELAQSRALELDGQIVIKEEEVSLLRNAVRDSSIKFVFQSIRRQDNDALTEAHPATAAQKAAAKAAGENNDPPFNPDTYPGALILATMVEPHFDHNDEEQVAEMDEWLSSSAFNQGEFMALFVAAVGVQQERKVVELGKG